MDKRAKTPKARPAPPQPSPAPSTFASCPAPEPFGELPAPAAALAPAPLVTVPITMPATRPKPKKARAAEESASKGARRPGEEAELLVKLDHEGVTKHALQLVWPAHVSPPSFLSLCFSLPCAHRAPELPSSVRTKIKRKPLKRATENRQVAFKGRTISLVATMEG